MANEITVSGSLSFAKGNVATETFTVGPINVTVSGTGFKKGTQTWATGGTTIDVTGLASLGWYLFKNNDSTNTIKIAPSVGGAYTTEIPPGQFAMGYFESGVSAPQGVALVAPCQAEYFIVER